MEGHGRGASPFLMAFTTSQNLNIVVDQSRGRTHNKIMEDIIDLLCRPPRTDYECRKPGIGMAIRRRKKEDGLQWYGIMQLTGTELYLFDDGVAYKPTSEQYTAAIELVHKWNEELRVKRKM